MPTPVNTYKRKYKPYKRVYKKKSMDAGTLALKKVKKLENSLETKYITSNSTAILDNGGTVFPLSSGIIQGLTDSERIGDKIKFLNLYMRLTVVAPYFPLTGNRYTLANFYRVIIYKDKCQNLNSVSDVIPAASVGNPFIINSFTIFDKKEEMKILYDKTFSIQNNGQDAQRQVRIKIPLRYLVSYDGAGAGDVEKNGLKMIVCSDEIAAAVTNANLYWERRLTYKDA